MLGARECNTAHRVQAARVTLTRRRACGRLRGNRARHTDVSRPSFDDGGKESGMANPGAQGGVSRRSFLVAGAATMALPAALASAQSKTPRTGGTFISAKTTEAPSLEPNLEQALSRHRLDPLFYNRLVEWSADGKLDPSLAESWTTSADGKTWTFKLRQGVKFHNGREFVSADVKYTYERVLDPKIGSGGRGYLTAIDGIEAPDKYTVRLHTLQPSASLLAGLAGNWSSIVPREEIEK